MKLKVVTVPKQLMYTNNMYISTEKSIKSKYIKIFNSVFNIDYINHREYENIDTNSIAMNLFHRNFLKVQLDIILDIEEIDCNIQLKTMVLKLVPINIKNTISINIEDINLTNFNDKIFQIDQCFLIKINNNWIKAEIIALDSENGSYGIYTKDTIVSYIKGSSNINIDGISDDISTHIMSIDFEKLGIGGLGKEFTQIFRRAFASRTYPNNIIKKLGIKHIKGILLYGPPGCGKTLIARQISKVLQGSIEPKIVNGPEILSKYVGESEKNIRELFFDAEQNPNKLNIIIMDEIDAIAKVRGNDNIGVHDSIVNQMLSKIDGVNSLDNILLIGMTNRLDIIDQALLRPGRFEVQVEIGLPDEFGRLQILQIHTNKIKESGYLSDDVDLNILANETKNFTGAEIEGLVKNAVSYSFQRNIDQNKNDNIIVKFDDFMNSLKECKPMFGSNDDEDIRQLFSKGIIEYSNILNDIKEVINSRNTNLLTLLLSGINGSGKTALSAKLLCDLGYPFSRFVSPDIFIGLSETSKCQKLIKIFEEAYKSEKSLIIFDDIERIIEFSKIGYRYSNMILQTMMILLKKNPPKGRKLVIISTTSVIKYLEELDLLQTFDFSINIPLIETEEQLSIVSNYYKKNYHLKFPISIKKYLL